MPGGDTALDDAMEVKELGSNPLTVLQFHMHNIRKHGNTGYNTEIICCAFGCGVPFYAHLFVILSKRKTCGEGRTKQYAVGLTFYQSMWYVESERTWWRCC